MCHSFATASSLPKAISTKTIADDSQLSCLATPRRSSIQRPSAISSGGHRYSSTSPTKLPQLRHQRPHSVYHLSSLPRPVSPSRTGKKLSSATSVTRSGGGDISRRFSLSTMTGNAHNRDAELGRVRATNYDEDSNRRNSTSVPVSPAKRYVVVNTAMTNRSVPIKRRIVLFFYSCYNNGVFVS